MNPIDKPNDEPVRSADDRLDARVSALLRPLAEQAPPPDEAFLAALRARSLDAFVVAAAGAGSMSSGGAGGTEAHEPSHSANGNTARKPMLSLAMRGLLAVAASIAALVSWTHFGGPTPVSGAPLGDVIAHMQAAKSLELRILRDGRAADVLVAAPGLVRFQTSPTEYRIQNGSRLWRIDEKAGSATESDSPWFGGPSDPVDLVKLLEVDATDTRPLRDAKPVDQRLYAGRVCNVYQAELPSKNRVLAIQAYADARSQELVAITARDALAPKDGPPLAELQLIAMNAPVDETKFQVAKSLADDGRIGKIHDLQGIVLLRPALAQRWTPIGREMPNKTGDWLRTELRGANAVTVHSTNGVELTLGPGSLVELISPTQARLHYGEAQVNLPAAGKDRESGVGGRESGKAAVTFELLAPRAGAKKFAEPGKAIVRVDRSENLVDVKKPPQWLLAFEGVSANESLGSLIVKLPDGRNEPLSVGYHKVSVEIRDQIARTTIEESFVNNTNSRLEGVFHFPLPSDASISGFGMWIGNDLIEADVVEKQRAREIYETILREKRDPGLLEWTAGNLFKARVFPIEAHSEKRIKIVYTQVLPLRANRYRYSYGLRSDMLRTTPLRELSLNVTVSSAIPLADVTCPTHSTRIEKTRHAAQVDFSAQEYSPDRDFEVVCQLDQSQSDVVVVPHQRGSDGYLLVQLTPPSSAGNWQRELLPEGQPLQLVLLCDTSGSMDSEKRKAQSEFVSTVLASLGEKDRFMLAAADVSTVWLDKEPLSPSAEHLAKARDFLDQRVSLGWTNLDQGFDTVLRRAPDGAQIVYVGDGVITANDRDAGDFVRRLGKLIADRGAGRAAEAGGKNEKKDKSKPDWTLSSVTVGSVHEAAVMRGIAAVGHGSSRAITGDQTPQIVAREWLNEIAQPGIKDLKVEWRGVQVAAMYPERLPNLAAGTQQILVGRYLPSGKEQTGEIVVTGTRGGEPVRYAAKINFKDADEGNSFIPRLWARSHLDFLLGQGSTPTLHDDIIALSEEFHIITPFTSLLVLESDADRERFGVKRRFEMRDGEQFFAEGTAKANFELAQQQTKKARDWQLGLRRQVLRQLATLGRVQPWQARPAYRSLSRARLSVLSETLDVNGPMSGPVGGEPVDNYFAIGGVPLEEAERRKDSALGLDVPLGEVDFDGATSLYSRLQSDDRRELSYRGDLDDLGALVDGKQLEDFKRQSGRGANEFDEKAAYEFGNVAYDGETPFGSERFENLEGLTALAGKPMSTSAYALSTPVLSNATFYDSLDDSISMGRWAHGYGGRAGGLMSGRGYGYYGYVNYTAWVNSLFPALSPAPGKPARPPKPKRWSAEALELSRSLSRLDLLEKLSGGIELTVTSDGFDPIWKRTSSHSRELTLYSPKAWLTRPRNPDQQTLVNYCEEKARGVYSVAFLLGRKRAAHERDFKPTLSLPDWSTTAPHETFSGYVAKVEKTGDHEQTLIITSPPTGKFEDRIVIDTDKHVALKQETYLDGKLTSRITMSDFVEVGGAWWATKITTTDEKDRKTAETTVSVKALAAEAFAGRMKEELSERPRVQFLNMPLSRLSEARQHVADGRASFDDHILLILQNCQLQQWDEVTRQLDAAVKLAGDKPGVRWLPIMIDATRGRNEEAREGLLKEAKSLADRPQPDEAYLAEFIASQLAGRLGPNEMLAALDVLKPVYDRQPAESALHRDWLNRLSQAYDSLGRTDDALRIRKQVAEAAPWETSYQVDYARRLLGAGRADEAYAWLDKQLARPEERSPQDDETLRTGYADLYRGQTRWADLLKFTTAWTERKPKTSSPYSQHLAALIYNEKLDAANELAHQWFREARVEGKLSDDTLARLTAAISYAQGSAYNVYLYRQWPKWLGELTDTARFFVTKPEHLSLVQQAAGWYRLNETDAMDRLRAYYLTLLEQKLADLTPEQISYLVNNVLNGRFEFAQPQGGRRQMDAGELDPQIWTKLAKALHDRWEKTAEDEDQGPHATLSETLRTLYANKLPDKLLPFLRERIEKATADYKQTYIADLFRTLITQPWSEEIEKESLETIRRLAGDNETGIDIWVQVPALHQFDDAMLASRQTRANQALLDAGEVDKLTRTELAAKRANFRREAIAGLAKRLAEEIAHVKDQKDPLLPWLRMEKGWLDVELNRALERAEDPAAAEAKRDAEKQIEAYRQYCWTVLGEAPPKPAEINADEITPAESQRIALDSLLQSRALTSVMYLATRRGAEQRTVDQLIKYLDAGAGRDAEESLRWKVAKLQLLTALDRPDEIEKSLRQWIAADKSLAPWRKTLAMVVAELGKIDEAVRLFEALEKDDLLSAADYRTLASWYQALGRQEDYDRARYQALFKLPEQYLAQIVNVERNRWQSSDAAHLPTGLNDDTLLAFRAIFAKSASPQNYYWQLREIYGNCRDFRLLAMLPDAMLGSTPERIYAQLEAVKNNVLSEMRNEATADMMLKHLKELRDGKLTASDRRALDLFEAMIERQSAEVQNQRGPHVEACLAALKRAFDREWAKGEPRLMADLLSNFGGLPDDRLRDEQLRELAQLATKVEAGSRDHLAIVAAHARLLFYHYQRRHEALRMMEIEVTAYSQQQKDRWPFEDDNFLSEYVQMLEDLGQFPAGERVLQKYLASSVGPQQTAWLKDRLWNLYTRALDSDGATSLGSGATLLDALLDRAKADLAQADDEQQRTQLANRVVQTLEIGRRKSTSPNDRSGIRLEHIKDEVRRLAFETIPSLLKQQQSQYSNMAQMPLSLISQTLGDHESLRYAVERMEHWPAWLDVTQNNAWQSFGYWLAEHHGAAGDGSDLEKRVLKLTLAELRKYLETDESQNAAIYHANNQQFWAAKKPDFLEVANQVYREYRSSGRRVASIANYVWGGLKVGDRAVEMLLVAQHDGILDTNGRRTLVTWLQELGRYAESIVLLEPLIEQSPGDMYLRAMLMKAYYRTSRPEQLKELVAQIERDFHEKGRWTADNIAIFADASYQCGLLPSAVKYYNEAISLRQRQQPRAGSGDAQLSGWYQQLAHAEQALGHTIEAVSAASGAIECWGPTNSQRTGAIDVLRDVLIKAKDLDAFVKHWDDETGKSGEDSALIRKAIGQAYKDGHRELKKAVVQYELARQLQPNDKEIFQALIVCYDELGDKKQGTRVLLEQLDFDRHDFNLYKQLAQRLVGDEPEADRAATSIVEAGPTEAENHQALAELRQSQNRWAEAIDQWREVADLRKLEPNGLIKLAEAQLHQRRWDDAAKTIHSLRTTAWAQRFNVTGNIDQLSRVLEAGRKSN